MILTRRRLRARQPFALLALFAHLKLYFPLHSALENTMYIVYKIYLPPNVAYTNAFITIHNDTRVCLDDSVSYALSTPLLFIHVYYMPMGTSHYFSNDKSTWSTPLCWNKNDSLITYGRSRATGHGRMEKKKKKEREQKRMTRPPPRVSFARTSLPKKLLHQKIMSWWHRKKRQDNAFYPGIKSIHVILHYCFRFSNDI